MSTEATQLWRRKRLSDLAIKFGGRAELGRAIGYKDGAYIRQMIDGERAISEKTIAKLENLRGYEGWFASEKIAGTKTVLTEQLPAIAGAIDSISAALQKLDEESRKEVAHLFSAYAHNPRSATKSALIAAITQTQTEEFLKKA